MTTTPPLPEWLADPALRRVWVEARPRLEASGGQARGRLRLTGLDRATRHAVSGLLGRSVVTDAVTLDLADVDETLRARAGMTLAGVVTAATGAALVDRPAVRAAAADRRAVPLAALRSAVASSPSLAGAAWAEAWLDDVKASGVLTRDVRWERTVPGAVAVLEALAPPGARWSRVELAVACAHDAHALDEGTVLSALVLRALAARTGGAGVPRDARARRELWESAGVVSDLVSTTCLTVGLRPVGEDPLSRRLRLAADHGAVVHLTARDLRGTTLAVAAGTAVLGCENPRVLEAFADRHAGSAAVVCTAGWPALVVLDVLHALADSGARLLYHGDFDWPGVEIASWLVHVAGVVPWLMRAADYEEAAPASGGTPLAGRPAEPVWDAELGAAMRSRGVVVHEEAVLDVLLARWGTAAGC